MSLESAQFRIEKRYRDQLLALAEAKRLSLSEFLRMFVTDALERDASQDVADNLAQLSDESRDLRAEVQSLRTSLSVVLELVLRNAPSSEEQVDMIMDKLRERGLIHRWSRQSQQSSRTTATISAN